MTAIQQQADILMRRERKSKRREDKLTKRFDVKSLTVEHRIGLRISHVAKARVYVPLVDGLRHSDGDSAHFLLDESHIAHMEVVDPI
jgi:hypothetical protein